MCVEEANQWSVHKFGGTSVASAECYRKCASIVDSLRSDDVRIAVVVSAMGGKPKVTDMLLESVPLAAAGNLEKAHELLDVVETKYINAVTDLLGDSERGAKLSATIKSDISDLRDMMRAIRLMRFKGEEVLELVSGFGEVWSAQVLCALLSSMGLPFSYVNAKDVLFVDNSKKDDDPDVLWSMTEKALGEKMATMPAKTHLVITGYVASTKDGAATTLKRDGSDYSASIFGKLLLAREVTIWTDVDGVLTADPRRVPRAKVLDCISYREAMELAYFGAKVIHPKTLTPAAMHEIPIFVRNTFNESFCGTKIHVSNDHTLQRPTCVCGFSTMDGMAVINLEGTGMIGVPGVAARLFGALHQNAISVTLIAQASSEQSICLAIADRHADAAEAAIKEVFAADILRGFVSSVFTVRNCSVIAAVGDGIGTTPGVCGRFFESLGNANVNVLAISQGYEGRNISAVVPEKDSGKALRAVHAGFMLSTNVLAVAVLGTGKIGQAIFQVIHDRKVAFEERYNSSLEVVAWANSKHMLLADTMSAVPLDWDGNEREGITRPVDLQKVIDHVSVLHGPHCVVIDCTPSAEIAEQHPEWLAKGIHIVTANKHGLGGSISLYRSIMEQRAVANYFYETTVCSGHPVISTVRQIMNGGDEIQMIQGAFSTTMNYVLSKACPVEDNAQALSLEEAVREAIQEGFTEKEFMEDLRGDEVLGKLLILAREFGVESKDVVVEPFIPGLFVFPKEQDCECDAVMKVLREGEAAFRESVANARRQGNVLRYVGRIKRCKDTSKYCVTVKTEEVPTSSLLGKLNTCAVEFHTECYNDPPLVVAGALGGDKAVAAALLADVTHLIRNLGAFDRGSLQLMRHLTQNLKGDGLRLPDTPSSSLLFKPRDRHMKRVESW